MKILERLLVASIAALPGPVTAQEATRAELPRVKVGDNWTYQRNDLVTRDKGGRSSVTVESVDADKIVVRLLKSTATYTREWNQTSTTQGGQETYRATPAFAKYRFPLEVGKQWESRFKTQSGGGVTGHDWRFTVKVEAVEKVTVPAGTFEAFRLRLDGWYTCNLGCNWSSRRRETFWYAPAVNYEIKREVEAVAQGTGYWDVQRYELVSFTPGE